MESNPRAIACEISALPIWQPRPINYERKKMGDRRTKRKKERKRRGRREEKGETDRCIEERGREPKRESARKGEKERARTRERKRKCERASKSETETSKGKPADKD